ncbi:MAG: peptide chain release factor N(5)-glutamine methyltransferase [Holosporaceae bacterium]|jgi:release factor glutamine methyltransferase|nr:peptide chain release factor N(5)-glutamine methyltransferase [Holosporaceae bacterium]
MSTKISVADFLPKFINGAAASSGHEKNRILRDVRLMVASLKQVSPEQVQFSPEDLYLTLKELQILNEMLIRYNNEEPISKIIHRRFFWKHAFYVNGNVLDPRPETELIIESVLEHFDPHLPLRFLDLGTGSGCILLSLLQEYENSVGVGIDLSKEAIEVAERNREMFSKSIAERANFLPMNWNDLGKAQSFGKKDRFNASFDVVVGNPPYIRSADIELLPVNVKNYDPIVALDGGPYGTESFREIIGIAKKMLNASGKIFLETGIWQSNVVKRLLQSNGFFCLDIRQDLNGIDRVIVGEMYSFK